MKKPTLPKGLNASTAGQAFIAVMVLGDEAAATLTKGIRDLKAKLAPADFVSGACEALRDYCERNVLSWDDKVGDKEVIAASRRAATQRLQYWRNRFGDAAGGKFNRQKDGEGKFLSTFAFEAAAPEGAATEGAATEGAATEGAEKKKRGARQNKGAGAVTLAQFEALRAAAPDIAIAFARMVLAEARAEGVIEEVQEQDADAVMRANIEAAEAEVKAAEARAIEARAKAQAHAKALADANAATKLKGGTRK